MWSTSFAPQVEAPTPSRAEQLHGSSATAWIYAQPAIGRRSKQSAPLILHPHALAPARGPGALSAGRRSKSSSALVRPQTSEWHGLSATTAESDIKARPRSGGLGLKLARTPLLASPSAINARRPSADERRRRMAQVSALAAQAEQAAAALREASAERERLAADVAAGEQVLSAKHASALAYEKAVHTALRQLHAAEQANARAAERGDVLHTAGLPDGAAALDGARANAAGGGSVGRAGVDFEGRVMRPPLFELGEERAAEALAQLGRRIAQAHVAGSIPQLDEPARAVASALADGGVNGGVTTTYAVTLAHAPWIEVDPCSWAVLLPARIVDSDDDDDDDDREARAAEAAPGDGGSPPSAQADDGRRARRAWGSDSGKGASEGGAGASEGSGDDDGGGDGGGEAERVRAVPIEAVCVQHAALSARARELRAAAEQLEVHVRSMAQAAQFEQMDRDGDGLVTLADAMSRAAEWGIPLAVLQRAFAGLVLPLSGAPGAMSARDFSRFVEWVEDGGQSKHGLRAWVRCLDLDGDGRIGTEDLRGWFDAIHAPGARAHAPCAKLALDAEDRARTAAGEGEGGAIRPFAQAPAAQRPGAHIDVGGADTPRAASAGPKPAEAVGSAGDEAVGGSCTLADLVCQLVDMASAGPPSPPASLSRHSARSCSPWRGVDDRRTGTRVSGLTFASLHRSKLAPAILQLLLTPQPGLKG